MPHSPHPIISTTIVPLAPFGLGRPGTPHLSDWLPLEKNEETRSVRIPPAFFRSDLTTGKQQAKYQKCCHLPCGPSAAAKPLLLGLTITMGEIRCRRVVHRIIPLNKYIPTALLLFAYKTIFENASISVVYFHTAQLDSFARRGRVKRAGFTGHK